MTEAEWLAGTDYAGMLRVVCGGRWRRAWRSLTAPDSARRLQRKMRLFMCACCRGEGEGYASFDVRAKAAAEVAERLADG